MKEKVMSVDNINIEKFVSSRNGFKKNTLYCFNYHLEGELCNKCISKKICDTEKAKYKFFCSELKKKSKSNDMSLKSLEKIRKEVRIDDRFK